MATERNHSEIGLGRSTGRMTAVMRAAALPPGPKVLRVGLVRAGRVLEERLVKDRGDVTVGRDGSATFVVPCEPTAVLARRGGGYTLRLGAGMAARVAFDEGVRSFSEGDAIDLGEGARGRVTLPGGATLLFQHVSAPAPAPTPVLPHAVRAGDEIDWNLTILVALSFLFHFGLVGALYSDWADGKVQDAATVAGLLDLAKLAPPNVPLESHDVASAPTTVAADAPKAVASAHEPLPRSGPASHSPSSGASRAGKEAAMVASAERMAMDVLGSLGASGTASDRALRRGSEVPPVDMSAEAQKASSVGPSGPLATRSMGPVGPGSSDLSTLGTTRAAPGRDSAGPARDTRGPALDTRIDPARLTVPVSDADRVVAGLRPRFRRCYEQGLQDDPQMSGKATLTARIGANGEVTGVDASVNGLSAAVGSCLARTLKSAQFAAPGATGSTLTVPVTLVQSGR